MKRFFSTRLSDKMREATIAIPRRQQAGVPTIDTLGVRGGGMHRPDEHIQLDSLVERTTLFAILMHRLDRDGFGDWPGSGRSIS